MNKHKKRKIRKMKNTNRVIAITVLSLLMVLMLIPTVIAQPSPFIAKSIAGVKDSDNATYLLGNAGSGSDLVQLINVGPNGIIDNPPYSGGEPSGDDSLICDIRIGVGVGPGDYDKGKFIKGTEVNTGTVVYCRAWNNPSPSDADYYGDSDTYTTTGVEDEEHNFDFWYTNNFTGSLPPIPDLPALILFASGLVLISVYFVYGRRKKEGE